MINREYSQDKQHKTAQFMPQTTELFRGVRASTLLSNRTANFLFMPDLVWSGF